MSQLIVKSELCPQNHRCPATLACPKQALTQVGFSAPSVDVSKCIKCGKCTTICPKGALTIG